MEGTLPERELAPAGFVLAGGKSSRMGADKALALFQGKPLIENALNIMRSAGVTTFISASRHDLRNFAEELTDGFLAAGPLGGIHGALSATTSEWNVFLPVDMPLMPSSLLATLLQRSQLTGAPVTVAQVNGQIEPFPVVLHRSTLPLIEERLKAGENGCQAAWRAVSTALDTPLTAVAVENLVQTGQCCSPSGFPPAWWFESANTPAQLARLADLARKMDLRQNWRT
jgi:molybdopterin-guanine dinucleotide biosynthesis protein A